MNKHTILSIHTLIKNGLQLLLHKYKCPWNATTTKIV